VKRLRGPVALLDRLSEDGRILEATGAQLDSVPVPVMALQKQVDGHAGSTLVGRCVFQVKDGVLSAAGEIAWEKDVQVPIGRHSCGLDSRFGEGDYDRTEDVLIIRRWRPIGLTIHLDPSARNAFPVEDLEVYEA
jgi:hypothetical protein